MCFESGRKQFSHVDSFFRATVSAWTGHSFKNQTHLIFLPLISYKTPTHLLFHLPFNTQPPTQPHQNEAAGLLNESRQLPWVLRVHRGGCVCWGIDWIVQQWSLANSMYAPSTWSLSYRHTKKTHIQTQTSAGYNYSHSQTHQHTRTHTCSMENHYLWVTDCPYARNNYTLSSTHTNTYTHAQSQMLQSQAQTPCYILTSSTEAQ